MAFIIPLGIGVASLITGITSGYFLFHTEEKSTHENTNSGFVNNIVEVDKKNNGNEKVTLYLLITIILLLVLNLLFNIYKQKKSSLKDKYIRQGAIQSKIESV